MDDQFAPEGPLAVKAQSSYFDTWTPSERARPRVTFSPDTARGDTSKPSLPRNRRPRTSVFKELDIDAMPDGQASENFRNSLAARSTQRLHADSFDSIQSDESLLDYYERTGSSVDSRSSTNTQNAWESSWRTLSSSRLTMLALIFLIAMPLLYDTPLLGRAGKSFIGASAGVITRSELPKHEFRDGKLILPRQNTHTDVCQRWSGQSALVNGTIYYYGGRSNTDPTQTENTWNNDFLTIDVTKSWDISSPSIVGLPQPSGPPPVANGYLWNSYDSLFLYGGEYSSQPTTKPQPYSLWEYDIKGSSWKEHRSPMSSKGNNSDGGNQPILGSAEGAGIGVPELGRGFFFAGHEDPYTTPGWAQPVPRIYLKTLLEFTYPGYSNDGVQSLGGGKSAGSDGAWRNVTQGGIQDTALFPSRADSALVYVPGYGVDGILVSFGGGTNESFVSEKKSRRRQQYTADTSQFLDPNECDRRV
jgi:hypothetical protein